MKSRKLTKELQARIADAIVSDRSPDVEDRLERANELMAELERHVWNILVPTALRKKLADLPDGWFREVDTITVAFNGKYQNIESPFGKVRIPYSLDGEVQKFGPRENATMMWEEIERLRGEAKE